MKESNTGLSKKTIQCMAEMLLSTEKNHVFPHLVSAFYQMPVALGAHLQERARTEILFGSVHNMCHGSSGITERNVHCSFLILFYPARKSVDLYRDH